jgi:flavodoxin
MKNAVVYYSFTHNNEKLARYLSEKLQCERLRIDPVKAQNGFSIFLDILFGRRPAINPLPKSLAAYDHVIFVSPIWAGKIASPLKSLLQKEKALIFRYSFVSLCGGAPGQKEKIEREFLSLLGAKPQAHVELSVNDAMALHPQEKTGYTTSGYRVNAGELHVYDARLVQFIQECSLTDAV